MCAARPTHLARLDTLGLNFQPTLRRRNVLETIVVLLLILWVLGLVSSYTLGGLIHLLLVVAIVVVIIRVIQGRKVL